jgi:predicted small integral membrane protein
MRALAALAPLLLPSAARAQAKPGWGNVGNQEPQGFSWTQPLFDDFWMAWTPATLAFFVFVFACIALMGLLEWRNPGGNPRHGVLGLDTTRGDRLFIALLGTGWVVLGWLFFFSTPIWGGLALAAAWAAFVFWKV